MWHVMWQVMWHYVNTQFLLTPSVKLIFEKDRFNSFSSVLLRALKNEGITQC
jgi:hypothetical protein